MGRNHPPLSAALVAIANNLQAVWGTIGDGVTTAFNGIKEIFSNVWNYIKIPCAGRRVGDLRFSHRRFYRPESDVSNILSALSNAVSGIWNGIKAVVSGVVNAIVSAVLRRMEWSVVYNQHGLQRDQQHRTGDLERHQGVYQRAMSAISGVVSARGMGCCSIVSSVCQGISNTVQSIWNGILGFFRGLPGTLGASIGSSMFNAP